MAEFQPNAEQMATFAPIMALWGEKHAAMSEEYRTKVEAKMADKDHMAADKEYFNNTIWPYASENDHINRQGWDKMMEKTNER